MLAGAVAAAVWAVAEPPLGRAFGTPYSDVKMLQGLTRSGPGGALAVHLVNGAIFGAVFERLGWRGPVRGALAAQAENLLLWPGMVVVQRIYPSCRSGEWPPLLTSRRVFAYEAAAHALFGIVLGLLLTREVE
jgi:hypothetical protein